MNKEQRQAATDAVAKYLAATIADNDLTRTVARKIVNIVARVLLETP